jgi:hypothetical protein
VPITCVQVYSGNHMQSHVSNVQQMQQTALAPNNHMPSTNRMAAHQAANFIRGVDAVCSRLVGIPAVLWVADPRLVLYDPRLYVITGWGWRIPNHWRPCSQHRRLCSKHWSCSQHWSHLHVGCSSLLQLARWSVIVGCNLHTGDNSTMYGSVRVRQHTLYDLMHKKLLRA